MQRKSENILSGSLLLFLGENLFRSIIILRLLSALLIKNNKKRLNPLHHHDGSEEDSRYFNIA